MEISPLHRIGEKLTPRIPEREVVLIGDRQKREMKVVATRRGEEATTCELSRIVVGWRRPEDDDVGFGGWSDGRTNSSTKKSEITDHKRNSNGRRRRKGKPRS